MSQGKARGPISPTVGVTEEGNPARCHYRGGYQTHGSSKEGYAEEGRSEEGRSQEGFPQEVSEEGRKALWEELRTPAGFEPGRGFLFCGFLLTY